MLIDDEIDAIINTLPTSMHCEWTIKAAEAGKHILCEKPIAVDMNELKAMQNAAEKNHVLLMEAFTHRFKKEIRFIRQFIASGEMGRTKMVLCDLVYPIQDWDNDIRVNKELNGGALYDCGCYCISLIRFILNKEPVGFQAMKSIRKPNNVDSTFSSQMIFDDCTLAHFVCSQETVFKASLEVITDKGRIWINDFLNGNIVEYILNNE